jgi:carbamate kinase
MGWKMVEDSGRGWRHVVPSPLPKHIVDISLIQTVAKSGAVVIAGGGGGVPVVRSGKGQRHGVEAVIDKPTQRELDRVSLSEILKLHAEGHFPPGSMGPKIDAAVQFLKGGGRRVMIGRLEDAVPVLRGETGTHIVAD